ncbi:MAG: peroxide stress protein YaaA [Saprospiraceae bacterium]|nr:peroxide stress protein YaaA [Saprospiraceae bacterium]
MLLLISPAKTLDLSTSKQTTFTQPNLLEQSEVLVEILKDYTSEDLGKLMKVSEKIADLNVERYKAFQTPFTLKNSKQALLAFKGDVYKGINVETFSEDDFAYAQEHLGILSGLYGFLRPMDLIQAYRLEMGTRLATEKGKNLYEFWDNLVNEKIQAYLDDKNYTTVVNLASKEYSKVIDPKQLKTDWYNVDFKEKKGDSYRTIAIYAKKARGLMCQFVIKNRLSNIEELKKFDFEEYAYNSALSTEKNLVFSR